MSAETAEDPLASVARFGTVSVVAVPYCGWILAIVGLLVQRLSRSHVEMMNDSQSQLFSAADLSIAKSNHFIAVSRRHCSSIDHYRQHLSDSGGHHRVVHSDFIKRVGCQRLQNGNRCS